MAEEAATGIKYEEELIINRRGLKLFTCRWLPTNQEPKALMFLCHGYAADCSISMRGTGLRLAQAGMAVHGVDYEGHGKTSGLQGYVPCFDDVVGDCSDFFSSIAERKENKNKRKFLLGESMGGAVALLVHRRQPSFWDGAVLVAPMCKVSLPFLIVQGEEDRVVDPKVCRLLFESASSSDKTLKVYPGMWHGLTSGEPPENIDRVFADIVSWLDQRIKQGTCRAECERKSGHDICAPSS